jgi:lycopene cyclase domain-containing protein
MKQLYLIINISSIIVPFLFSFHPKILFYKKWKAFFVSVLFSLIVFVPWDILFTHLGVWSFNSKYLLGIYFFNLPIEEVLFFLCIPYSCIFTYHFIIKSIKMDWMLKAEKTISYVLVILLIVIAAVNYYKLYTSVTFMAFASFILLLKFAFRVSWLHKFYFTYLILLIPFFIVNGILTGTGPDEPVVLYNNAQNLGIRVGTIPIEDVIYGMFLLMLNVSIFEYLSTKLKD